MNDRCTVMQLANDPASCNVSTTHIPIQQYTSSDPYINILPEYNDAVNITYSQPEELISNQNNGNTGTFVSIEESAKEFFQRLQRWDFILIYTSIVIVSIIFFISSYFGTETEWYRNLNKFPIDNWVIDFLWVLATLASYLGLFFLWQHITPDLITKDLIVSTYFLIGLFIFLSWSVSFYHAENIGLAVWISLLLFVYRFWLFIYIWYIKPFAAIFFIPILLMNIYLVYYMLHIAYINDVPL